MANMDSQTDGLESLIGTQVEHHTMRMDNGIDLHYVTAGSGRPLLLLHGANMGWGQWYGNIAALARHFQVFALDMPNAGQSSDIPEAEKINFQRHFADTVEAFIARNGFASLNIVGHSLGAWVALKLALNEKTAIDKLVLVSPVGFSRHTPVGQAVLGLNIVAKVLARTAMKPSHENFKKFLATGFHDASKLTEQFSRYYHDAIAGKHSRHPFLLINSMAGLRKVNQELILLDQLKHIDRPVLVILGKHDRIVLPSQEHIDAFKLIPGARVEIFTDSGHVPFIEQAAEFNKVVVEFLTAAA